MKSRILPFALCGAVIAGLPSAPAAAAVSVDAVPGRLPKDVVPVAYRIAVVPDLTTMKIAGDETIAVHVRRATPRIVLNALQTTVASAALDGRSAASIRTAPEIVTLTWPRPIAPGMHTLHLRYTATVQK